VVRLADALTRGVLGAGVTAGRESFTEAELRDLVAANVLLDREERRLIDGVIMVAARHVREVTRRCRCRPPWHWPGAPGTPAFRSSTARTTTWSASCTCATC
jgi:hypothetical protein